MSLIALSVALPLLAGFLLQPLSRVSVFLARVLGPLVLVACAALIWQVWSAAGDAPFSVALGGFAPPFGISFYVDQLALLFALAVPLLALVFWPRGERDGRVREDALTLLLVASCIGLALSGDLFNLYVFYELVAVASFGLVASSGTARSYVATIRYLIISGFGSVLALVGIAIIYTKTGTLNIAQLAQLGPGHLVDPLGLAAFVALLLGFGVKGELFPVNTWVAEVYATAPRRVSAILAGLVSKLAVLVVVRLLVLVFQHHPDATQVMLTLGVLGMVTGELAAWRARDFPRMLAFSSIGQLGLGVNASSLPGAVGLFAGLAVALHHLLVKPALFALAERWHGSLDALAGAARDAPIACGLFVLFALSLIGVPPLPGFWTKLLVLVGLAQEGQPLHLTAFAAILAVTVLEANYLFRLAARFYRKVDEPPRPHARLDIGAAALLGAVVIAVTLMIDPIGDRLRRVALQAADTATYVATVFPPSVGQRD